jgi:hypothetical protein
VIEMKWIRAAALCAACAAVVVLPTLANGGVARGGVAVPRPEASAGWIVDRSDNICGLDDPKMLSKPAKVDYDAVLRATPEMKKMKDDKIDPNSPQGIQLRQAAASRVQKAADKVRTADGYCSVWKSIKHQDGRAIPDVTDAVKAQL